MTAPKPTAMDEIRHHVQWTGYVLIAGLLGGQALLGSALQADGAADPTSMFIQVLMFTWPLSVAVAIGIVGFVRIPVLTSNAAYAAGFAAGLALGALALARNLAGQRIVADFPQPMPQGLYALPWLAGGILQGFMNAYGPLVFWGAFVVGGGIAWIWFDVIEPRMTA